MGDHSDHFIMLAIPQYLATSQQHLGFWNGGKWITQIIENPHKTDSPGERHSSCSWRSRSPLCTSRAVSLALTQRVVAPAACGRIPLALAAGSGRPRLSLRTSPALARPGALTTFRRMTRKNSSAIWSSGIQLPRISRSFDDILIFQNDEPY